MSIYVLQNETALAVPPATSDSFVVYSTVAARTRSVPANLVAVTPMLVTSATSLTTGTNFPPYGLVTIASSNNGLGFVISPPTSAGLKLYISNPTTNVATVTTSAATILTQSSTAIVTLTFDDATRTGFAELVSISTAVWHLATSTSTLNFAVS